MYNFKFMLRIIWAKWIIVSYSLCSLCPMHRLWRLTDFNLQRNGWQNFAVTVVYKEYCHISYQKHNIYAALRKCWKKSVHIQWNILTCAQKIELQALLQFRRRHWSWCVVFIAKNEPFWLCPNLPKATQQKTHSGKIIPSDLV